MTDILYPCQLDNLNREGVYYRKNLLLLIRHPGKQSSVVNNTIYMLQKNSKYSLCNVFNMTNYDS